MTLLHKLYIQKNIATICFGSHEAIFRLYLKGPSYKIGNALNSKIWFKFLD